MADRRTKAELLAALEKSEHTVRVFRGMLRRRNAEYDKVRARLDHYRREAATRSNYQVRMYAALRGLREIAGSTYGRWPNGHSTTVATERLKEDAVQEAIDNGKVKGKRPLPRM